MTDISIGDVIQNVSFAGLFVVLFWWTLRTNENREARYLSLLDGYGKQLEAISATLKVIEEQVEALAKVGNRKGG